MNQKSQLVIHDKHGEIKDKDSFGNHLHSSGDKIE